jgi:hypothetical protein
MFMLTLLGGSSSAAFSEPSSPQPDGLSPRAAGAGSFALFLPAVFTSPPPPSGPPPSAPTGLDALAGDHQVTLTWNPNPEPTVHRYNIYAARTEAGPYLWQASVLAPAHAYVQKGLEDGARYYYRVAAVDAQDQAGNLSNTVLVMTARGIAFSQESANHFHLQYLVGTKWASYVFNQVTQGDSRGYYEQFISGIYFGNISVASTAPYLGGVPGMILMEFNTDSFNVPRLAAVVESLSSAGVTIKYSSIEPGGGVDAGKLIVRFVVEPGKPYLQIKAEQTPSRSTLAHYSWNVFPQYEGRFNPWLRVVVPYDQTRYYVINGQALGVHYFPRIKPWSLRMGAEGTASSRITTGFFFPSPSEARPMTYAGWAMGHDYCPGLSSVPYGLDKVFDQLYVNYQEDEGNWCRGDVPSYAWQNADNTITGAPAGKTVYARIDYWVGEDDWNGSYGPNYISQYQFTIDKLYLELIKAAK